jgi:hypothetical protein
MFSVVMLLLLNDILSKFTLKEHQEAASLAAVNAFCLIGYTSYWSIVLGVARLDCHPQGADNNTWKGISITNSHITAAVC